MKEGDVYETKCGLCRIVSYSSSRYMEVTFERTGYTTSCQASQLRKGTLKDPYFPSIFGTGYFGEGAHRAYLDGSSTKKYQTWIDMLSRCYNTQDSRYPRYGQRKVIVHKDWLNFQVFGDWFDKFYIKDFEMDKDILCKGNKVYSEQHCRYVPSHVNNLLTFSNKARGEYPLGVTYMRSSNKFVSQVQRGKGGSEHLGCFDSPRQAHLAYKKAKEDYIKIVARIEFRLGNIDEDIYEALNNYIIEEYPE